MLLARRKRQIEQERGKQESTTQGPDQKKQKREEIEKGINCQACDNGVALPCITHFTQVQPLVLEAVQSAPPEPVVIEKIVERIVEVPVEKIVKEVVEVPVEKIVEKIVEVPVDRVVEIPIFDPQCFDPEAWYPPKEWTPKKQLDFVTAKFPQLPKAFEIFYDARRRASSVAARGTSYRGTGYAINPGRCGGDGCPTPSTTN